MNKTLLTIDAVAERSSVSRTAVKEWIRNDGCPVIRFSSRLVRIPIAEFDAWYRAKIEGGVESQEGAGSDWRPIQVIKNAVGDRRRPITK